jgi:hypothetical protein
MLRQLHSGPAAAAIVVVICVAASSFVLFALLPARGVSALPILPVTPLPTMVGNLGKAAGLILLLGYTSGVIGWLVMFAVGGDGLHRLPSVLNDRVH